MSLAHELAEALAHATPASRVGTLQGLLQSGALTEAEQIRRRDLGTLVAHGRREVGLSQRQLAERLGTTLHQVIRLEDGQADPSPLLSQIAEAIGATPEWFGTAIPDRPNLSPPVRVPISNQPFEAEQLRRRVAELETQLAEHAKANARISELEAELRTVEEQLSGRDQRIAELSAQLAQLEHRTNGELAAPFEEKTESSESRLVLSSVLAQPDARRMPEEAPRMSEPSTSEHVLELELDREPRRRDWGTEFESQPTRPPVRRPREAVNEPRVAVRASRRRPLATRKAMIGLAAVAALVVLAVLGFTLFGGGHTSPAAQPASPSPALPAVKPAVKPTTKRLPPSVTPRSAIPAAVKPARNVHTLLAPAKTPVLVLNGNGVAGAAGREAVLVRQAGYPVSHVTNASRQDYALSFVMYRPGLRTEALKLARKLGVRTVSPLKALQPNDLGRAKLVIVTGRG